MSLDVPDLDGRAYDDILADARRLIPVYAEEWTDHNATDPGITVLELLAWLAESYGYQLNRVTDAHVRRFLTLMGAGPRGPTRATAHLTAHPTAPTYVAEGEPLTAVVGPDRVEPFETVADAYLTTARLVTVASNHEGGRVDNTEANGTPGMHFLAFGDRAVRGSVMYLGFDGDPFGAVPHTLDALDLAVTFNEEGLPTPAADDASLFEPTVGLRWQYCRDYTRWYAPDAWEDFEVAFDETNQLHGSGTVRLTRPDVWTPAAWAVGDAGVFNYSRGLHWIRALIAGTDAPGESGPGYEVPPRVTSLSLNGLRVRHGGVVTEPETLVRTDDPAETATRAEAGQRFGFAHRPVRADDVVVTVGGPDSPENGDGDDAERWRQVETFDASGPDDRHFVVDETAGELVFGDGWRGKIPAAEQRVVARRYRFGGGTGGNVPATATWRFGSDSTHRHDLTVRGPASGGRAAQTTDEALASLQRDLETRHRAVTAADFVAVATTTPGLRFGRAHAWIDERPSPEGCSAQRHVTVAVVPYSTRPRPEPSDGFLAAVERHLCRHRLLTDRVSVQPPTYVGIEVDVEVTLAPGERGADQADAIETALDAFLDPLPNETSEGWPFGRSVYPSEVYEVVEGVDGIECVEDVSIVAYGSSFEFGTDGAVVVPENGLVYPMDHDVTVRTDEDACEGGVR